MTFGCKYMITFGDAKSDYDTWLLEIYVLGYTGTSSYLKGTGTPLIHELLAKDDSKFDTIKGSSLEVNVYAETAGKFLDDLVIAGEKTVKGKLYKNASIYWNGWLSIEDYGEQLIYHPYSVTFTFTDYLGKLKDYKFDDNDYLYTGKKSLLDVIIICLGKTGFELNIQEGIDIYASGMDYGDADSTLTQTYVNCEAFLDDDIPIDCYEVLKRCIEIFGARIWQEDNYWWIVPVTVLKVPYVTREFNGLTGAYIGFNGVLYNNYITINNATTAAASRNLFLNQSGFRELDRAYKSVNINQNYLLRNSILYNDHFKYYDGNNYPIYWDRIGTKIDSRIQKYEGERSLFTTSLLYVGVFSADHNNYITQSFILPSYATIQYKKIKINLEAYIYRSIKIHCEVKIQSSTKTYWMDINGAWTNSLDQRIIHTVTYDYSSDDTNQKISYSIESDKFLDYGGEAVLSVRLYSPIMLGGSVQTSVFFTKFSLEFVESPTDFIEEKDYYFEINDKNSKEFELDAKLGDLPSDNNINYLLYNGGLYRKDGSSYIATTLWNTRNIGELLPLLQIVLNNIVSMYNYNTWIYTGELMGHLTPKTIVKDSNGRIFIINDYTHNLKMSTFDCRLLQIKPASPESEEGNYMEWQEGGFIEWQEGGYVEPT